MSAPSLPPQLDHTYVVTHAQRRVDTLRRTIHALDAQRVQAVRVRAHEVRVRVAVARRRCGCHGKGDAHKVTHTKFERQCAAGRMRCRLGMG